MADYRSSVWRRWGLRIGGGVLVFAAGIFAAWEVGALNGAVLWAVGKASGYRISCSTLDGGLLSKFTCRDLSVADAKGAFLTARSFSLDWNPWVLIDNTVKLNKIDLVDAKFTHLPASSSSSSSSSSGFLPGMKIEIGLLQGRHVALAMETAPQVCLNLGLRGAIGPDGFNAAMALNRCVPEKGKATFSGYYVKKTGALKLDAQGEDDGALAAALTGVKTAGATRLTLNAAGTLASFDGKFHLSAQNLATIDTSFNARDLTATSFDARFDIVRALLPRWAPQGAGTLSADVTRGPKGGFDISSLLLDWGGVRGTGQLALTVEGRLDGKLSLDTTRAFTIAGGTRLGGLKLETRIAGTKEAPRLNGSATLSDVSKGAMTLAALRADFEAAQTSDGTITASLVGDVHGADLPAPVGGLLGDAFGLRVSLRRVASGFVSFDAALNGQAATLQARAGVGDDRGSGDVSLAVPDLAKADAGFGGQATADLHFDKLTLNGVADGTLKLQGEKIESTGLGAALGASPSLSVALHVAGGHYALKDLTIDTAALAAHGSASLGTKGALAAELTTTRGELAPLSALLGRRLWGAFSLTAKVSGTEAKPVVALEASAPRLSIDKNIARNVALALDVRKDGQWTGQLVTKASTPTGAVDVAANVETLDNGWQATIAKGALGPIKLSGQLAKTDQDYRGALTLKGRLLEPVGFFLGQNMQGSGTLALRGEGRKLHLVADLSHIKAAPLGDASLKADAAIENFSGPFTVALALKDGKNHVALDGSGTLSPLEVTLKKFDGAWYGADFALKAPTTLAETKGRLTLDSTTMTIAGGTLTLAGQSEAGQLSASAHLAHMPVAPLASMMRLGKAKGTIGLDVTAEMTPDKTDAQARLHAQDLLFASAGKKEKPANIDLSAKWNGAVMALQGRISGLDTKDATMSAQVPMVRAAGGYMPKLASSGPVTGQLRAQLQAGRLLALLPLAEQTASGLLTASADVSGDISAPQIAGKIALADGSFTDFETGTRLDKLNASIEATGNSRLQLKLAATDGNSGTIKADGEFSVSELETGSVGKVAGHLDVNLDDAQIVREDLVHASASGHVALDLPGDQPGEISGQLRTNTVRVDLGAAIPPDIPQIDVTEINAGPQPEAIAPPRPSLFSKAGLDIAITMPNRVYVSGHGTDSEWSGNLQVGGTLAGPDVSGKLSLVRGQAEFIGKDFTLSDGTVQIANSIPGNASLHVVAQNESSDITVTLTIDGPVTKPQLSWSSSPTLPQSEILSHLFFGTSTPHLSVAQAFQLAQLSGQLDSIGLGGSGGGGILSFARNLVGLDVLRVSGPTDTEGTGASVTAGKYVTDNVYVGVKQGANVSAGTAQVEVKLTPHIRVDAEAGANSQGSAGVTWKWDY